MSQEMANLKKDQLQKIMALKHGGWKLKYALKRVGMSYTTYRRALAGYSNLIGDLILEQYEIDLEQYIQGINKRRERLQVLFTEPDVNSRIPLEDIHALDKRLAAIRAELQTHHYEFSRPHAVESPSKDDAEICLELIGDGIRSHSEASKVESAEIPITDDKTDST